MSDRINISDETKCPKCGAAAKRNIVLNGATMYTCGSYFSRDGCFLQDYRCLRRQLAVAKDTLQIENRAKSEAEQRVRVLELELAAMRQDNERLGMIIDHARIIAPVELDAAEAWAALSQRTR